MSSIYLHRRSPSPALFFERPNLRPVELPGVETVVQNAFKNPSASTTGLRPNNVPLILYADNGDIPPLRPNFTGPIAAKLCGYLVQNDEKGFSAAVKFVKESRFPTEAWLDALTQLSYNPFRLAQALTIINFCNFDLDRAILRKNHVYKKLMDNLVFNIEFDKFTPVALRDLRDAGFKPTDEELLARARFHITGYLAGLLEKCRPFTPKRWKETEDSLIGHLGSFINDGHEWGGFTIVARKISIEHEPLKIKMAIFLSRTMHRGKMSPADRKTLEHERENWYQSLHEWHEGAEEGDISADEYKPVNPSLKYWIKYNSRYYEENRNGE